jgi:hypothetical protein
MKAKYQERFGGRPFIPYFSEGLRECLGSCRVVDCSGASARAEGESLVNTMNTYRKLPVRLGFVPCHKLFEGRAALRVRMLEGDMDIAADEDTILMIGLKGEVYPMEFSKFIETYNLTGERFSAVLPYPPTVLDKNTGLRVSLLEFADACVSSGEGTVLAARLESRVNVFTRWDDENYVQGVPGDWIAARSPDDLYIVTADVFDELYVRDYTGENLSCREDALSAVKKDSLVSVTFAAAAGTLDTREGPVAYREGDALLTGFQGESWPVALEYFRETYTPAPGTKPGSAGEYRKNSLVVRALRLDEPFAVELSGQKGVLRGERGDWLLQYAPGEYGVVAGKIFEKTYDICAAPVLQVP